MDKKQATEALKKVKEISPKRKFKQSYDLVINLKGLDLKKPDHKIDFYTQLGHPNGKEIKVCALVGPELKDSAKASCNETVLNDSFAKYADKKAAKKLANSYDYFIAQANLMKDIASSFGRVFGPKGKMPNPKAGCVVPPNANLKVLSDKLKKTIRLRVINDPVIRCLVGKEDMKDEEVLDNVMNIYDQVVHHLPGGKHNVKDICLKLSMGPVVKVGEKIDEEEVEKRKKPKPKTEEKPAEPKEEKKPSQKAAKAEPKVKEKKPKVKEEKSEA